MLLRVRTRPAKCAPSQDPPKIILSNARQSETYSVAIEISRSPVALPGWLHSRNAPIYDAHTRPSKNLINMIDVIRYLNVTKTVPKTAYSLLSVVNLSLPPVSALLLPTGTRGTLNHVIHIQLSHPCSNQLKAVTKRYLSALDIDKAIDRVAQACHQYAALRQTP